MQEQEILKEIEGLVSSVLKRDNVTLSPATVAADVDGWDSLTHMMIIDSIEKKFGVKFKLKEVMKFNNLGDIITCVQGKVAS